MAGLIFPNDLDRIPTDPDPRFTIEIHTLQGRTWYRAGDAHGTPGLWTQDREVAELDLECMAAQRGECLACDGTGYREYRKPVPGITYCECAKGRAERRRILARNRAEQEAERAANLPY